MNDLYFVYLPVRATNINLIHVCRRQNFSTYFSPPVLLQVKAEFENIQGFNKKYFCGLNVIKNISKKYRNAVSSTVLSDYE